MNIRNIIIGLLSVSALGGIVATASVSEATICGPQNVWTIPLFCGPPGVSTVFFEAKSQGLVGPDRIQATLGTQTAAIKRAKATGRTSGGTFCCFVDDITKNGNANGQTKPCPPIAGQCALPSKHDAISLTTL